MKSLINIHGPVIRIAFYRIKQTLLIVALMALIVSCDTDNSAPDGPFINVYTALEDDELSIYLDLWEETYPEIDLRITRDSTGVITSRLLAEKANPTADVVWGVALSSLLVLDQNQMLEGYAPADLENIKEGFYDARNTPPRWVGIKAWMTAFICNTVEFEKAGLPYPGSFRDLIDPKYKGLITMPDPSSSGTGYLTVAAILKLMGEEKGWEYLDQLHQNVAQYVHSGSKPAKLAGRGEFPIGISFGYRGVRQKIYGEPVKTIFPAEGSGWDLESNCLIKKNEIKPEARQFLDWAVSENLMREYAKFYPIVSRKIDISVDDEDYPEEPEKQLIDNDFYWMAENRKRILDKWAARYEGAGDE